MSFDRLFGNLVDVDPLPPKWTERRVAQRLIDAYATLRNMSEGGMPSGHGSPWPAYQHDFGELAIQAGAGTLLQGSRIRPRATGDEIALMEDAIGWISKYLRDANAWARIAVITWADQRDADPDDERRPRALLHHLAAALDADNHVVL